MAGPSVARIPREEVFRVVEIVNGRVPKSINQFYNKKLACLKSVCQQMTGHYSSNKIRHFTAKRNRKIDDYMHKASKLIVEKCTELEINTIVIGQNKEWKQDSQLSRRVNQHFVQLPFARLIQMIEYKARERGIAVILTEESYTSGTSFLDKEAPVKENYDKTRRIHRGLFRANNGRLINADVNGAFQIMEKSIPECFGRRDRGRSAASGCGSCCVDRLLGADLSDTQLVESS